MYRSRRFCRVNINELPVSCLKRIFAYLPLSSAFQLGLVCRKWHALQWSVFCRHRALTLLVGKDALELMVDSRFAIPHLDEVVDEGGDQLPIGASPYGSNWSTLALLTLSRPMVHFLADSLPNITYLEVALKEISSSTLEHLLYLIDAWFYRLIRLRIFCRFPSEVHRSTVSDRLHRLLQLINSLPAIRSLTLSLDNRFLPCGPDPRLNYQIYLPVLARLEEFHFYSTDEPDSLLDSLRRFAEPNRQLRCLSIANFIDATNLVSPERFLRLSPRLVARTTGLFIMKPPIDKSQLFQFCSLYTSLTSIRIYNIHLTLTQLANCLTPLRSLVHLGFAIKFFKRPSLTVDDTVPTRQISQLRSIRILSLTVSLKSHTDLHSIHLGWIFPQLQVLSINHDFFYCITCKTDHYRKTSKVKCRECMRQLLAPWKQQCSKLRRIYTRSYRKVTQWNVEEL